MNLHEGVYSLSGPNYETQRKFILPRWADLVGMSKGRKFLRRARGFRCWDFVRDDMAAAVTSGKADAEEVFETARGEETNLLRSGTGDPKICGGRLLERI